MAYSQGSGKGHCHCVLGRTWIMGSAPVYFVLILIPVLIIRENTKNQSLP